MNESQFSEGAALNTFGEEFDFEGKEYVFKKQYLPDKTKPIQIPDHLYIIQRYMTLSTDREMEGAKYQHKTIVNMICEELMTVCGWIKIPFTGTLLGIIGCNCPGSCA